MVTFLLYLLKARSNFSLVIKMRSWWALRNNTHENVEATKCLFLQEFLTLKLVQAQPPASVYQSITDCSYPLLTLVASTPSMLWFSVFEFFQFSGHLFICHLSSLVDLEELNINLFSLLFILSLGVTTSEFFILNWSRNQKLGQPISNAHIFTSSIQISKW